MKFAIIYYSKTGHTREMAEVIARGLAAAGGETRFFSVEEAMDADYIDQCAGVIFGTPTYLANTCWQMNQWFDEGSRGIKLAGKLGGVFATAHYAQGGADVAIMTLPASYAGQGHAGLFRRRCPRQALHPSGSCGSGCRGQPL